jgi:hypothetical protein
MGTCRAPFAPFSSLRSLPAQKMSHNRACRITVLMGLDP